MTRILLATIGVLVLALAALFFIHSGTVSRLGEAKADIERLSSALQTANERVSTLAEKASEAESRLNDQAVQSALIQKGLADELAAARAAADQANEEADKEIRQEGTGDAVFDTRGIR